mgnify:CR=1 FL=1
MLTYQDYEENTEPVADFVKKAISQYQSSELYKMACIAYDYNRQRNTTINTFSKIMYKVNGQKMTDPTAANNKIASNFFRRLNVQRCTYSLGNGVSFSKNGIKEQFGKKFDTVLQGAGYDALIYGVSYLFMTDRVYNFKATEFLPLLDEYTGELRAGIRFWKLAPEKPLVAVFYEKDGYTKFCEDKDGNFVEYEPKEAYVKKVQWTEAFGEEVIGESNYPSIPVVPLWGSELHQSTLVGMRATIDAYDLTKSGFANDLEDCAQIYWIVENYGGMQDDDLRKFLDRLKFNHIANANTGDGGRVAPYTQEIPYNARKVFLDDIRSGIYEDYGGLDVHTMAAGATNDHIDAAYQPLDENADDFEAQIIECVQKLGAILGIDEDDCVPLFKRNRISNQKEQVEMLIMEAEYLDEETMLDKLPNVTVDEKAAILKRKAAEDADRIPLTDDTENGDINGEAV